MTPSASRRASVLALMAMIMRVSAKFVYDGTSSDLAQQFYTLHHSGNVQPKLSLAASDLPEAVIDRLASADVKFDDLPGLLQRALLWDAGYVFERDTTKPVAVNTECGLTMADIAVSSVEYKKAGCTFQPNCSISQRNGQCSGDDITPAVLCATQGVTAAHNSAMWATGGDAKSVPEPNLVMHRWEEKSKIQLMYAIHTVGKSEAYYGNCPTSTADVGIIIPCLPIDDTRKWCKPKPGDLVTMWLKNPTGTNSSDSSKTQDSGKDASPPAVPNAATESPKISEPNKSTKKSNTAVYIVVAVAGVAVVAVFVWLGRRKLAARNNQSGDEYLVADTPTNDQSTSKQTVATEFVAEPPECPIPAAASTIDRSNSSGPTAGSSLTNTADRIMSGGSIALVERTLSEDPVLAEKRIPFENIEFTKPLSRGANGSVWLCKFHGNEIAVKQVLQHRNESHKAIQSFIAEIQLTASLDHPHIIRFIGVAWTCLENLSLAMEFLPSGDLLTFLHKNDDMLTWFRDKLPIAIGIARAMEYLHSRSPPLIHRDIKAKNVLLTRSLSAKLIDFGVSRDRALETMTAGIGTPYWAAPEVLDGTRYTEQSDVYSFGVLLSEIDSATVPYENACHPSTGEKLKTLQILNMIVAGTLRPQFRPDCPRRIVSVATACFENDPAKRPTASQIVLMLMGHTPTDDSQSY